MANLWRTQRPRFPLYQSDGFGRDYYIKYTNGGYWENQFFLRKKPDYERHRYNNFHSLYHLAAPVKYFANGSGRENYILQFNGFHHEQKPLYSYQLTDFLRNERYIKPSPAHLKKKAYLSVAETRYNKQLKSLEKQLVKRLYKDPMKERKRQKLTIETNDINEKDNNFTFKKNENQKNENISSSYKRINTEPTPFYDNGRKKNINFNFKNTQSLDINNMINNNKKKFNLYKGIPNKKTKKFGNTCYGSFGHSKNLGYAKTIDYSIPINNNEDIIEI